MFNLRFFRDRKKHVERFWAKNIRKLKMYLKQKKEDDVIISASPEFLVRSACEKINLKNIMLQVKIET
jgi:phosphoserine phosphatase